MSTAAIVQDQLARLRFSGHESFPVRFSWLAKGVRFCAENPEGFADPEAMVSLGVGKNMVRSIRFWCLESGMIEPVRRTSGLRVAAVTPTELGDFLFGHNGFDPYLEDPATLWLMHWGLSSRRDGPTTWYFLFNEFRSSEFNKKSFLNDLRRYEARYSDSPAADATLIRDWECCVRCYVGSNSDRKLLGEDVLDCPLAELDLLHRAGGDDFYFPRAGRSSLPAPVFVACLVNHWSSVGNGARTISFDQLAYGPGSPGQVFRLSENALVDLLTGCEALTDGAIRFGSTAGLRQVLIGDSLPRPLSLLRKHYKKRSRHGTA